MSGRSLPVLIFLQYPTPGWYQPSEQEKKKEKDFSEVF